MKKRVINFNSFVLMILFFCPTMLIGQTTELLEKVSLQLPWKHQFEFAGFYAALEKGYYKEKAIDLTIKEYKPGTYIVDSIISGESTFGTLYSSIIKDRIQGKPIILLANYFKRSPLALVTRPNIFSLDQLKGKKVMGEKHELNSANYIQMFQQFNMTADDFSIIPHTFNTDKFINGEVDAMTVFLTNEVFNLRKKKVSFNIIDPNNFGTPLYDVNLFTSEEQSNKNPKLVHNFIKASNRGWAYALEHPEEIVELILKKYNTQNKSREHLLFEAAETQKMVLPKVYPIGSIDPERVRKIEGVFISKGMTKTLVEPNTFIFGNKAIPSIFITPKEQEFLEKNPIIKAASTTNWEPFNFRSEDTKQATGIAHDYWMLVAKQAGFKTDFSFFDKFTIALKSVENKTTDIIYSVGVTRDREKYSVFTKPYITFPLSIATSKDENFIQNASFLNGQKVAVGKDFTAHKMMLQNFPDIAYIPVTNVREGLEMVSKGEAFAFVEMMPILVHNINKWGFTNLKISGNTGLNFNLRFMIRNDYPELVSISNKIFQTITPEEKQQIINKWNRKLAGLNRKIVHNEIQLREAKDEAEFANLSKSEFLANISHELRTPLNAILGFSQIMSHSRNLTPDQTEHLRIINRSGEHLLTLINDVLDMSAIESGRLMLADNNFDLYRLLDDLKEMFRIRSDKKGLEIRFEHTPEVPRFIGTDEAKLRQVLINLISNAVKFTEKGRIFVSVSVGNKRSTSDSSQYTDLIPLYFEIQDTGLGIEAKEMDHIFEAFLQTKTGKASSEGTGLGLAISQKFVQLMGGKININSQVGQGSVFSFGIKVHEGDKTQVATEIPVRRVVGLQPSFGGVKAKKSRILIVDDILSNRQVLKTLLTPLELDVREVNSGQAALLVWKEWQPDLILLDMHIPEMDGYEVIKHIKQSAKKQVPPIVSITASAFE